MAVPVLVRPFSETIEKVIVHTLANKERPGSCYEIRIALRPAVSDPFFLRPTPTIRKMFAVCDVSGVLKNSLSIVPAANSAFALGCGCGSRHLSARFCSFPKRALSAGGTGAGRGWQLWTDVRVPIPNFSQVGRSENTEGVGDRSARRASA